MKYHTFINIIRIFYTYIIYSNYYKLLIVVNDNLGLFYIKLILNSSLF